MRGAFVLVLGAGVAVAFGLGLWEDGPGTDGSDADADPPIARLAHDGNGGDLSDADPDAAATPTPPPAADVEALVSRVDAALDDDRVDAAARLLLETEVRALESADVRVRVLRVANALVREAADERGARSLEQRLVARRLLSAVYDCEAASRDEHDRAFAECAALHDRLLMASNAPDALVLRHRIQPGDRLWTLAKGPWKESGVTVAPGFVLHVNHISSARRLRVGKTLRVPKERLSLLVRKSRFELSVLLGGSPVARFPVGIGANSSTPTGTFRVETKIKEPPWWFEGRRIPFGDPENVIGTRWIGFEDTADAEGIGIHGTSDEATVGKAVSMGCVRMRRADVEQLFDWVSHGAEIEIRD